MLIMEFHVCGGRLLTHLDGNAKFSYSLGEVYVRVQRGHLNQHFTFKFYSPVFLSLSLRKPKKISYYLLSLPLAMECITVGFLIMTY